MDNRPARGKRIGRRAGRRGHDQAIGSVLRDKISVNTQIEINHSRHGAFVQDGVVERAMRFDALARAEHLGLEHHALAHVMLARQHLFEQRVEFLPRDACQKAEPTKIDRKNRHSPLCRGPRRRQQRSVAAQHDQ